MESQKIFFEEFYTQQVGIQVGELHTNRGRNYGEMEGEETQVGRGCIFVINIRSKLLKIENVCFKKEAEMALFFMDSIKIKGFIAGFFQLESLAFLRRRRYNLSKW